MNNMGGVDSGSAFLGVWDLGATEHGDARGEPFGMGVVVCAE